MRISVLLATCVVVLVPASVSAAAPTKAACVEAYEQTQVSMRRGQLLAARDSLVVCLDAACPKPLRSDCADWLKDIDARTPTVVVEWLGDPAIVRQTRLSIDGRTREGASEGRAVELDPGRHIVRAEREGAPPIVVEVIVHEGEKLKPVRIDVDPPAAPAAPLPLVLPPEPPPPPVTHRPVPWFVYATAGLGVLAAGGFTAFAVAGTSGKSDLEPCRPECSANEISDVRSKFVTADVFLGISIVALGASAILYLTRPTVVDERR